MADAVTDFRSLGPNGADLAEPLDIEAAEATIGPAPESGGEKHAEKQGEAATAKGREEVKSYMGPGANRTDEGWFSLRAPTKAHRKVTSKTRQKGAMEWDVFLSYRQAADEVLVTELYWKLLNMKITENGKERPLRVFWDKESLLGGNKWEDGFAKAICSSFLVVLVMSRGTFKMEGKHNVENLNEDSDADNVLLEYELALRLNEMQDTAIMPLFVGDKTGEGKGTYSHFFESKCLPEKPKPIGLKWENIGRQRPSSGSEISNKFLAEALRGRLQFTEEEFTAFKVSEVTASSYIQVDDNFFRPGEEMVTALPDKTVKKISEQVRNHLEKYASALPLGTKWENAGATKPEGGRELLNSSLSAALARKKEFTAHEWAEFDIRDLGEEDFIKAGSSYFKPSQDPKPRTVHALIKDVTSFQGFFLQGAAYDAKKGAVQYVHKCAARLAEEQGGRQQLEHLQFSTPQGEEVWRWLSECVLSCYGSTLAKNGLNSLRKVSHLTPSQLDNLHEKFCATSSLAGPAAEDQLGRRVALGESVKALTGDPRTHTLQQQLDDFADPMVTGLNLLDARNQMEVVMAKKQWLAFLLLVLTGYGTYCAGEAWQTLTNKPVWKPAIHTKVRSQDVAVFTVQLSTDGLSWRSVLSRDPGDGALEFRREAKDSEEIVRSLFPREDEARYMRVLTQIPMEGGDMRLGIIGGVDKTNLDYSVLHEGDPSQAWLQYGCNAGDATRDGQWASRDESIGQVECCLLHASVCSRDGCLSGDGAKGKSVNKTFYEAEALCEAQGRRLCTRQELSGVFSSGCCISNYPDLSKHSHGFQNMCGYDDKLVWTSVLGGLQELNSRGRLYSDNVLKGITQVTVDLGAVQVVRGIQTQGGRRGRALDGAACVASALSRPTWQLALAAILLVHARKSPLILTVAFSRGILFWTLVGLSTVIVISLDPMVPSVWSFNPICPSSSLSQTVRFQFTLAVAMTIASSGLFLLHHISGRVLLIFCSLFFWGFGLAFVVGGVLAFGLVCIALAIVAPLVLYALSRASRHAAKKRTENDIQRYEKAWADACGRSSSETRPDVTSGSSEWEGFAETSRRLAETLRRLRKVYPTSGKNGANGGAVSDGDNQRHVVGLQWRAIGTEKPKAGKEIVHKALADALRKKAQDKRSELGLKWQKGAKPITREASQNRVPPTLRRKGSIALQHPKLAEALRSKAGRDVEEATFTQEEWQKFDIESLPMGESVSVVAGDVSFQLPEVKFEFSEKEWEGFSIEDLSWRDAYIGVDMRENEKTYTYFHPVAPVSFHLEDIKKMCSTARSQIDEGRRRAFGESAKEFPLSTRLLFRIGAGGLGPYARTGKIRQSTCSIDSVFEEAANLNDSFFDLLEDILDIGVLCRGPVKRPDRGLQKVVRCFYRDASCLTDLVRCCILLESIEEFRKALHEILDQSIVHQGLEAKTHETDAEDTKKNKKDDTSGPDDVIPAEKPTQFRLCKIKDRFTDEKKIGYRDVCLNLEVGWTVESESTGELDFVPAQEFGQKYVRTHICEVQLMLRSMYELKVNGCHENFVAQRNLLSQ